jgi:hypothetical protein
VAQGEGPEFKPQYRKKNNKKDFIDLVLLCNSLEVYLSATYPNKIPNILE